MSNRKRNQALDKTVSFIVKGIQIVGMKLPRHFALLYGSTLGRLIWLALRVERKRLDVVRSNLRNLFPDEGESKLDARIRDVCIHFGKFLIEAGRLPVLKRNSFDGRIRFEGMDHFLGAYSQNKGLILATAHFGNFELGAGALALMGYPVYSVIRTVDNPHLDKVIDDIRLSTGLGIIKKENSAREILKRLRDRQIVTVHTDLHAGFNNMFVRFFGKWAATFTTPATMSLRTGVPIVAMYCFRNDKEDTYTIRFFPKIEIETSGNKGADIRQITTKINDTVEQVIREAPEQWFWLHRRWKMEPSDKDMEQIKKQQMLIDALNKKRNDQIE